MCLQMHTCKHMWLCARVYMYVYETQTCAVQNIASPQCGANNMPDTTTAHLNICGIPSAITYKQTNKKNMETHNVCSTIRVTTLSTHLQAHILVELSQHPERLSHELNECSCSEYKYAKRIPFNRWLFDEGTHPQCTEEEGREDT